MRKLTLLSGVTVLSLLPLVASGALTVAPSPSVVFNAVGPGGLSFQGKTPDLHLDEHGGTMVLTVPLANLDTGISLRNKHMKEKYLQTDRFPETSLTVEEGKLSLPAEGQHVSADIPGKFTLHGVTRDVTVHYAANRQGGAVRVEGGFKIDITDYKIEKPSYLGVGLQPEVEIKVAFQTQPR